MDNNTPIKYSDLIQPDNSILDLQKQLKDLAEEYKVVMDGIKAQASSLKASLSGISGATSQGQQTIKNAASIVEKLAKKEGELAQASSETAKKLIDVTGKLREKNNQTKLELKLANSVPGSYDAMSAQYSLNVIKLKAMSEEERKTTEEGIRLEKETGALRIKMKQMQEAVGNHTLSVGDYGIATASLAADIRSGIQALTQMRVEMKQLEAEGQKGSDRWQELSQNAMKLSEDLKELKRQYTFVKLETNALGNQMGVLNDVAGGLSAGSGALSALTGTVNLLGGSASGAAEALVQLNSVMAISNGVSQAWSGVLKMGNALLLAQKVILGAVTKLQNAQTKATKLNTVAQAALNIVAKANPYVLVVVALTALVGITLALVSANARWIKQQKQINQQTSATLDYMEAYNEENTRIYKENQKALEQELRIAKARKASYSETQKIENEIQAQKAEANAKSREYYAQEINDLDANRAELMRLREELLKAQKAKKNQKVEIQLDAEGPAKRIKAGKIIDIIQDKINNLGRKVEIATELVTDQKEIEAETEELREQHRQQAREVEALERQALRSAEDAQIALITHRFNRERAEAKASIARQITDLQVQLRTESNLTLKARKAINQQILDLQKQLVRNIADINASETQANRDAIRNLEDANLKSQQETAKKRREVLKMEYDREIEDIQFRLATERDLTETEVDALVAQLTARWAQYQRDRKDLEYEIAQDQIQKASDAIDNEMALISEGTTQALELRLRKIETERQEELIANKQTAEDMRQDEAAINRKYDQLALEETIKSKNEIAQAKLESDLSYEESVFNLRMHSETQIARFQLKQQKERLKGELEVQRELLKIRTGEEKELTEQTIKTIQNQINAIDREIKKTAKISNIWELFGFDSDAANALETITKQIVDDLKEITQARIDAADAAAQAAQKEVEASQKYWEYELEARANGYANSVELAQKELALNKEKERQALAEKKKAQEAQNRIDAISQASSLITASANIWSAFSGAGVVGIALALAGIATMWTSFLVSRAKAKQIASESYGEGTVELLRGGSHQSGNDVDLGTKPDGTRRRAEGGEYFAVINKRSSRKYAGLIPDVIRSLNNGTFASQYMGAYNKLGQLAVTDSGGGVTDLSQLEGDVSRIRKQGDTRVYTDSRGNVVTIYKNLTQRIRR